MKWTHPAIRRLRKAVERGETDAQIGAALNITAGAVEAARKRHKIRRVRQPRKSKVAREDVRAHLDAGHTDTVIAIDLGASPRTIARIRRELGAPYIPPPPIVDDAVLREMVGDDKTDGEIAVVMGCAPATVANRRRELGLLRPSLWPGYGCALDIDAGAILADREEGRSLAWIRRYHRISQPRLKRILAAP